MAQDFNSVPEMLLHRIAETPKNVAFMTPESSGWKDHTWEQLGQRVRAIAMGLRALGLQDEQRCAILSGTRYEWIIADLGILCAGGATTTIYPSNTPEDSAYIINDSNTVFLFAENDEQVKKIQNKRAELKSLKHLITFDGQASDDGFVITLAQLEEKGRALDAQDASRYEQIIKGVKKTSLATLVYTSGTTGRPKGVELTHDCWVFEGEGIDNLGLISKDDVQYFWLPLSHVFGKVLEAAQIRIGFKTAIDGRVDKLVDNLAVIKPTFVAAVPRIFEKVYNKVVTGAREGGGLKKSIFEWSIGVGREAGALRQKGQKPSGLLALKNAVADKLVFSKLKARFGGNLRFFISGSAPLSREIAEFFHAAEILVLEGYGLTESSAASCVNRPDKYRFGTVGPALPGIEVKIAADGEILLKGRGIMRGYHGLPEATKEALDSEGYLHTGDIGVIEDGFIKITDRKKDLIKTSVGKYVAPQSIEGKLKAACPYISQVLVHGDGRSYVTMLVSLDPEAIMKWAKENGMAGKSYTEVVSSKEAHALIEPFVANMNKELANYESVKKFAVLPKDLTLEDGDLTPSLKLKRKAVEQKYKSMLDAFYKDSAAA